MTEKEQRIEAKQVAVEREPEQMMRLKREMESREERWGEAKEATATREVN